MHSLSSPLLAPQPRFPARGPQTPHTKKPELLVPTLRETSSPQTHCAHHLDPACTGPCRHPRATPGLGQGVPLGAGTLQILLSGLCLSQQLSFAGVLFSPLYHANFSRDNFSTISPPARTETLYGAGPREAAALPRQTKAHCCR